MARKNILWLPSWYPNCEDVFDGDFIQRHAQAAAIENNIHVVFVKAVMQPVPTSEKIRNEGLTEEIIYIKKGHGFFKKLMRQFRWFQEYKKAIRAYIEKNGCPHLVHVHVPWRAGLVALWMKRAYGIPYLVTEHWGIYNDVVPDRFSKRPFWMQRLVKQILNGATIGVSVSRYLAAALQQYGLLKKFTVIPNVVDTSLFFYKAQADGPFTFLHVSNMVPLKNVTGLLDAFAEFQKKNKQAKLVLIGNKDDFYATYANGIGLNPQAVSFLGEVSYAVVAKHMQAAHCLVLNSDIENSPCVIGEALCCGLPVIATAVGGIPELVDSTNSISIPPRNTGALVDAMHAVYADFKKFDGCLIASVAKKKHGYAAVSENFRTLYDSVDPGLQ